MFTFEQTEELKLNYQAMKLKSEGRMTMKNKKEHAGIMHMRRQELKFRVIQERAYEATKLHKI